MVLRIVDHETKLDNQAQDNPWLLGHTITMDSPGHTSLTSAVALFATSPDLVFCLTDVVCPRHTSILPPPRNWLIGDVDYAQKAVRSAAPREHSFSCRRHATIFLGLFVLRRPVTTSA